ncbi:DUF2919 family protein (plasmid) [Salmonella enterica subsp. diarizonae]|uniref:DUF2919 family protein n=1 Tax=Salmonella diarizonae TaxID=59204 RepID=A0A8E9ZRH9_SALDZ|nr:DUF2919 domain-containing protein [Salmonella enterica]EAX3659594.1 DUF2919 domain-containing protein [Salmonella enterica]EAY8342566.1 DUF2919 domain-containing protein [Salmonella enterica]EBQ1069568.1 DUF2919 domain-containing protein [Salmonella enterica]QWJ71904.1 DUF2919 family protein [Salmonella enterica subsp. diarizonae]
MMRGHFYHSGDFDDNGLLKAPAIFWAGLIVLARAWWLSGLMVMMASAESISAGLLWPEPWLQFTALASGIPCIAMVFIYPLRERRPGLSRASYVLILLALFLMVLVDLTGLLTVPPGGWVIGWVFLCLDVACVVMLWPDRLLRAVFSYLL